jgi:SAM-dependent methyltransferase
MHPSMTFQALPTRIDDDPGGREALTMPDYPFTLPDIPFQERAMAHPAKSFWSDRTEAFGRTSSNASLFRFFGQGGFDFADKKVLEIGFGFGADLLEAERRGAEIYGIDISARAVDAMVQKTGRPNFRLGDVTRAPIDFPMPFDAIYCRDTIYYFTDDEIGTFARHCHAALAPAGILVIQFIQGNYRRKTASDPASVGPVRWEEWEMLDGVFHPDNPIRILAPEDVVRFLTAAGLTLTGKKTMWETYGIREEIMQCNRYLMFRPDRL